MLQTRPVQSPLHYSPYMSAPWHLGVHAPASLRRVANLPNLLDLTRHQGWKHPSQSGAKSTLLQAALYKQQCFPQLTLLFCPYLLTARMTLIGFTCKQRSSVLQPHFTLGAHESRAAFGGRCKCKVQELQLLLQKGKGRMPLRIGTDYFHPSSSPKIPMSFLRKLRCACRRAKAGCRRTGTSWFPQSRCWL